MNEKNRNLIVRIASAVVLLPVVLWLLWLGGIATILLVAVGIALVTIELYEMAGIRLRHPAAIFGILASASLRGWPRRWTRGGPASSACSR